MHSPGPKIGVTHAVTKVQHQGWDHLCRYHRLKRRSGLHMQAPQSRIDGGSLQAGTLPEAAAEHALFLQQTLEQQRLNMQSARAQPP